MLRPLLLAFVPFALAGCGHSFASNKVESPVIRGIVSVNGKPLDTGKIKFVAEDGQESWGWIWQSGEYIVNGRWDYRNGRSVQLEKSRPGPTRVVIDGEPLRPAPPGRRPPKLHPIKLPTEYLSAKSTPLTYTIKDGEQKFNIDLTINQDELDRLNPSKEKVPPTTGKPEPKPAPQKRAEAK